MTIARIIADRSGEVWSCHADDSVADAVEVLAGKRIGAMELWMGNPAKLVQVLTPERRAGFDRTAGHYVELSGRHRRALGG